MQLNATDIEFKLVNDLKLEEGFYMDRLQDIGVRRRRKMNSRRRAGNRWDGLEEPISGEMGAGNVMNEDEVLNEILSRRGLDFSQVSGMDPGMEAGMMSIPMQIKMEPGMLPDGIPRHLHENQEHYRQRK